MSSLPFSPSRKQIAAEILSRRKARASLTEFCTRLVGVGGYVPARHHLLLIEKLEAVERGETPRLMVLMPPGSAKSTYCSLLFPAWYLGRHPKRSVLAASHTTELAERFGRRVRNLVSEPDYQSVFDTRLAADSQAAGRWNTMSGGEFYAAGVGSAILGYRADVGIIDDPIAGREQADSEHDRERVWEWYKADFYSRLKPGAAVVLIMQRWHEDDLAGRILKDAERGGERWEVLSLPMEAEDDDPLGREPGELLWPEWFKPEQVEQAKRDTRNWLALYQQRPRPAGGGEFRREWLLHYKTRPGEGVNKYIVVDPANSKRKRSDYTAMLVIGLAQDKNYYLLDMIRDRLNLAERTKLLMEMHRIHQPLAVGYERYGAQSDIEHILEVQDQESYRFRITELSGQQGKEDRIRKLVPLFEQGRIWLPETLHRTDAQGGMRNLVQDFIEEEYLAFPVGIHDDLLDAMARIVDPDLGAVFPKLSPNFITPSIGALVYSGDPAQAWMT